MKIEKKRKMGRVIATVHPDIPPLIKRDAKQSEVKPSNIVNHILSKHYGKELKK